MGRLLLWTALVCTVLYYASTLLPHRSPPATAWSTASGAAYELIGDDALPDFPTPVVVTDNHGRSRWTVSIPPSHAFPLSPSEYADICTQTLEVSDHVADIHGHKHALHSPPHTDPHFLDVADAESAGLLSHPPGHTYSAPSRPLVGHPPLADAPLCARSLTVLLETPSAGLGATLLLLWTAYGLALSEHRAFFIDDSRWAYGAYTDFFAPPPIPTCRPPPRHHLLPCPHHARHLLVSAATAAHSFPTHDQPALFALARAGHDALFRLAPDDAAYVASRVAAIAQQAAADAAVVVAVHVRHGDRRPREFQYRDSYVPLYRYAAEARAAAAAAGGGPGARSLLLVASDDPDVYEADEFAGAQRAQSLIRLAGKGAAPPGEVDAERPGFRRFVEETVGWEGGFYAGMFWSLGGGAEGGEARRLRGLVGRAYLLDLAVLGRASGGVVCGAGAACRVLAVMVGEGGWRDVDAGGGGWGVEVEG